MYAMKIVCVRSKKYHYCVPAPYWLPCQCNGPSPTFGAEGLLEISSYPTCNYIPVIHCLTSWTSEDNSINLS
jgi:hypothetical protein